MDGKVDQKDDLAVFWKEAHPRGRAKKEEYGQIVKAPEDLFIEGRNYAVTYAFANPLNESPDQASEQGVEPDLVITFVETSPAMGAMKVDCPVMASIELQGRRAALLREPKGLVPIPAGDYGPVDITLFGGEKAGFFQASLKSIAIAEGQETLLKAGTPLSSKVTAVRSGSSIRMDQFLHGIGGEKYERSESGGELPAFVVRKAGRQIATGSFRYG
jgi:hypothetical protein